jgi:hypothetical protein
VFVFLVSPYIMLSGSVTGPTISRTVSVGHPASVVYSYTTVELKDVEGFAVGARVGVTLEYSPGWPRIPVVLPDDIEADVYVIKLRPHEAPRLGFFTDPRGLVDYLESRRTEKRRVVLERRRAAPGLWHYEGSVELTGLEGHHAIVALLDAAHIPSGTVSYWVNVDTYWVFKPTFNQVARASILAFSGALLLVADRLRGEPRRPGAGRRG